MQRRSISGKIVRFASLLKLPAFLKLTSTDLFAAWFVVTGDTTPDGIRVVRSVLGAIRTLLSFLRIAVMRGQTYRAGAEGGEEEHVRHDRHVRADALNIVPPHSGDKHHEGVDLSDFTQLRTSGHFEIEFGGRPSRPTAVAE